MSAAVTRRGLLLGSAALAAASLAPARAATTPTLRAAPAMAQLAPEGHPATPVWAYGDRVPGPVLRVRQGERLRRELVNGLPQPTTVHWHGVRLDNAMDGVPELTQPAVAPGERFLYDFVAPDAGTYWYHPHNRSWEQLARGLYGALIVEEPDPPEVDRDEALLLDDWRLTAEATLGESFDFIRDRSHAGRIGNWITVNGRGEWRLPVGRGERLRLRLANVANARLFELGLSGLSGWIVALGGQPLEEITVADRMTLAPGQRSDLIVDVTAAHDEEPMLISFERDGGYAVASFPLEHEARERRPNPPAPLPPNPLSPLGDLAEAESVDLHIEGGAMGGMRSARMGGRSLDLQELVEHGLVWSLNGVAGLPDKPLIAVERGRTVRLRIRNDTAWPHAMHLHGHHFRRLAADGTQGPLRDTDLVARGETIEVGFVADNPGDWLLHCHMLEHSAGGMITWLRVA